MDLDRVRQTRMDLDTYSAEYQAVLRIEGDKTRKALAEEFPTLTEYDQALIAWYICDLLSLLKTIPAAALSGTINDSTAFFGMASMQLLGMD